MKKDVDSFIYKGNIVAKPRMTRSDTWKKRPCVLKYWAFKDEINIQASEQGFRLGNAYRVEFYVEMPKSWSKKKKAEMKGRPHQQRFDLDNLIKSINDCLMEEDSTIYYFVAVKRWAEESSIHIENFPEFQLNNLEF